MARKIIQCGNSDVLGIIVNDNFEELYGLVGTGITGFYHQLYVDKNRTDTYTADGSLETPFKTIAAAIAIVNATVGENWKIIVAAGTYADALTITGPRYLRIEGAGVVISGAILFNSAIGTYDRVEFVGTATGQCDKGPAMTISGAITLTRTNDSLVYIGFSGCFISGAMVTTDSGTWTTHYTNCRVNGAITGTLPGFGTPAIHIMAYGYNTFTGAITGKVNLYDCNNAEFRSTINSTPNYPQRLIDCLFNTGTVTMAGVTPVAISVNGTSYKQLKARTPTLTDVTYIHVDGGVMIGAVTEILVGGGDGTNPVWTTATGTGAPVRATQPILDTPTIGTATFTSLKHTNIQILGAQVATLGLNAKTDANKITDIIAALRSHGIIGPNAV